jgi:hypothetical protein
LVRPCPGWTGFFYKYFFSPWLASGVLGAWDTYVMIRYKEVIGNTGGPRAWFCIAAVDCICVAIVNWVSALSGCDNAASSLRDENIRMFNNF